MALDPARSKKSSPGAYTIKQYELHAVLIERLWRHKEDPDLLKLLANLHSDDFSQAKGVSQTLSQKRFKELYQETTGFERHRPGWKDLQDNFQTWLDDFRQGPDYRRQNRLSAPTTTTMASIPTTLSSITTSSLTPAVLVPTTSTFVVTTTPNINSPRLASNPPASSAFRFPIFKTENPFNRHEDLNQRQAGSHIRLAAQARAQLEETELEQRQRALDEREQRLIQREEEQLQAQRTMEDRISSLERLLAVGQVSPVSRLQSERHITPGPTTNPHAVPYLASAPYPAKPYSAADRTFPPLASFPNQQPNPGLVPPSLNIHRDYHPVPTNSTFGPMQPHVPADNRHEDPNNRVRRLKPHELMEFDPKDTEVHFFISRIRVVVHQEGQTPVLNVLPFCLKGRALKWHTSLAPETHLQLSKSIDLWYFMLEQEFRRDPLEARREARRLRFRFDGELSISDYLFQKVNLLQACGTHDMESLKQELWEGLDSKLAMLTPPVQGESIQTYRQRIREVEFGARRDWETASRMARRSILQESRNATNRNRDNGRNDGSRNGYSRNRYQDQTQDKADDPAKRQGHDPLPEARKDRPWKRTAKVNLAVPKLESDSDEEDSKLLDQELQGTDSDSNSEN